MRQTGARAIAVSLVVIAGCARQGATSATAGADNATRAELIQIENEIVRANNRCDYDYFRRIEAPEFIFTDANGGVSSRADDLAGESQCRPSAREVVIDEVRVLDYGRLAVLNARNTTTVVQESRATSRQSRFTDVFVRRNGQWQLVSGQSTRIPQAG